MPSILDYSEPAPSSISRGGLSIVDSHGWEPPSRAATRATPFLLMSDWRDCVAHFAGFGRFEAMPANARELVKIRWKEGASGYRTAQEVMQFLRELEEVVHG